MAIEGELNKTDMMKQKSDLENLIKNLSDRIRKAENEISFINGVLFAINKQEIDNGNK